MQGQQQKQKRSLFHSVPLRAGKIAQQVQTQTRNTRNTTSNYVQTRKPPVQPSAQTRHTTMQPALPDFEEDDLEQEDDDIEQSVQRVAPRSARRYVDTQGRDVYQQGNRRVVVEHAKNHHWLLPAGLGMLAMVVLMVVLMWGANAWDNHQLDVTYGYPRHFDINQVVGIDHDSASQPSHFIFENLSTHVFFIFIPAGDISKAVIYPVVVLHGDNAASIPVTAKFQDVNGDGRPDILISIQDQTIVFLNTGNGFKPQV